MKIPFFTLERQNKKIGAEIKKAISKVIDSGIYVDGPKTKEFEEKWSELNQVKHTILTSSGTSALEMAIKCLRDNDDFLVPTNTFFASASQIPFHLIKFIDSDDSCNLDINLLDKHDDNINLIGVNLYSQPLDFDKLFKKINKRKFILDACQSAFSTYKNKPVASYCRLTAFSFYCTKIVGVFGELGCLCTNDDSLVDYIKSLRNHGRNKEGYQHDYVSGNLRGDEIQAAILLVKLKYMSEIIEQRINTVERYRKNLSGNSKIKLLPELSNCKVVNYVMPVFISNRDKVRDKLKQKGIDTLVHYPLCLHEQKPFKQLASPGDFPVAENQARTELSLPLFYEITDSEVDVVCGVLEKLTSS